MTDEAKPDAAGVKPIAASVRPVAPSVRPDAASVRPDAATVKPHTDHEDRMWIGPAGWSYEDWKGVVYPAGAGRKFDPLEYLARYFDVVEINSSFYRPPPAAWTRSWARRVEDHPRFRFTAKLWRGFTHERNAPPSAADVDAFREGIERAAGSGWIDDAFPVLVRPAGGTDPDPVLALGVDLRARDVRHSRFECIPSRETRLASPPGASRIDDPARTEPNPKRSRRPSSGAISRSQASSRGAENRSSWGAAATRFVSPTPRSRTLTRRAYAARNRSRAASATRRSLSVGVASVWLRVIVVKSR